MMATLYYRPYTTELQNDDGSSVTSTEDGVPPEFQYIFENDNQQEENHDNEIDKAIQPDISDKYKLAMRRMSTEIMYLRDQMKNLIKQNSSLRCEECGRGEESTMVLGEVIELDKVSKETLLQKYVNLKIKYEEVCSDVATQQEKIHKLQRELIKKNNNEAEFFKMKKAHSSQNTLVQNLQKRMQKLKQLEDTIKTQELIISKMEKQIEKKNSNKSKPVAEKLAPIIEVSSSRESGYHSLLLDENLRLKQEVDKLKVIHTKSNSNNMSDSERLELYQLLDRAEQRIMALEKQVSISQREWKSEQIRTTERDDFGLSKIKF